MRIAILGATSMLAADFVAWSLQRGSGYDFALFGRDPDRIRDALVVRKISVAPEIDVLDRFAHGRWDAIINFIGVGDPARAVAMGADIMRLTREWDDRVLAYLTSHPETRYIFISSGAAFGAAATDAIGPESQTRFDLNHLKPSAYYGISKFYAEAIHRSRSDQSIIDVRIFNYLSEFADLEHRYLVNEMLAAIKGQRTLSVDENDMYRDYLGREDFAQLIAVCLKAPPGYNGAVDAYSLAPTSKFDMLELFAREFGLAYRLSGGGLNATGAKSNYFSRNRAAEQLGYRPRASSLDTLKAAAAKILAA